MATKKLNLVKVYQDADGADDFNTPDGNKVWPDDPGLPRFMQEPAEERRNPEDERVRKHIFHYRHFNLGKEEDQAVYAALRQRVVDGHVMIRFEEHGGTIDAKEWYIEWIEVVFERPEYFYGTR